MYYTGFKGTRCIGLFIFLVFTLFCSFNASALGAEGVNRQIPFYGELVDNMGNPLDGEFNMTFTIYDAPTGGNLLWDGEYTSSNGNPVTVDDGEFRVLLGSGTGNEFGSELFVDDTHYLGIIVEDDDEMTPRERMGASPYAINADMLDGLHASNFLQQDTEIVTGLSNETSILTLTQQGGGDLMSLYNSGSVDPIFSVLNSGRAVAESFENLLDTENTFAGFLNVMSGDASSFGGDVLLADGAKLRLGGGNGIGLYQDMSILGPNGLMLLPEGSAIAEGSVHLLAPQSLILSANTNVDRTGTHEPSLEFGSGGTVSLSNTTQGDPGNKYIELDFTDGVKIPQGFVRIGSGDATVALDVAGTIRSEDVAGGFELESDVDGNIIQGAPVLSDIRFKQNIRPLTGALDMVELLHGVRYEWKDAERFGSQTEVGFIAQEVQEVVPEVVRDNGEYLSLNTKNIVAVVVEAIKELNIKVEEYFSHTERLEQEVADLRAEIDALKRGGSVRTDTSESETVNEVTAEVVLEETPEVVPEAVVTEEEIVPPIEEVSI
jgi:hypothetical protein